MSSVNSNSGSGSGSSGVDERIRKAREDYRKKEAELIKKHNKEIKELDARYINEIDKKDLQQSELLTVAREKTQEALTKKDMKYQREMEEMRTLQNKQVEKLMAENRQRLDAQIKASRAEVNQANLGRGDRVRELNQKYTQLAGEQEEKMTQSLNEIREDQKAQIDRSRSALMKKHEEEKELLRTGRDEDISKLKSEYDILKKNTTQRLRSQEIRHLQDNNRKDSSHMDHIKDQSEAFQRQQDLAREGYEHGLHSVQTEIARARDKDRSEQYETYSQFKNDVQERVDNQVNRLERDLNQARNQVIKDRVEADRKAKIQIDNSRDAYQDKFDYLEKARIEALQQNSDVNSESIKRAVSQADRQMSENTRYYKSKNELDNLKNRQHIDTLESNHKLMESYNRENSKTKFERLRESTEQTKSSMNEAYETNLKTLKDGNEEERKDLVLSHIKDKNRLESQYKEFLSKQEVAHQRQTEDVITRYEKKIAEMNDQFMREKRLRDNREKALVNELKRRHDVELEAVKIKYEDQSKQASLNYGRQLREVEARGQEKLNEVLSTVKKRNT